MTVTIISGTIITIGSGGTGTLATGSGTPSPSTTRSPGPESTGGLSSGQLASAVIGGVAAVVVIFLVAGYLLLQQRRRKNAQKRHGFKQGMDDDEFGEPLTMKSLRGPTFMNEELGGEREKQRERDSDSKIGNRYGDGGVLIHELVKVPEKVHSRSTSPSEPRSPQAYNRGPSSPQEYPHHLADGAFVHQSEDYLNGPHRILTRPLSHPQEGATFSKDVTSIPRKSPLRGNNATRGAISKAVYHYDDKDKDVNALSLEEREALVQAQQESLDRMRREQQEWFERMQKIFQSGGSVQQKPVTAGTMVVPVEIHRERGQ
ncbi:hypothetical protein BGZ59_010413 [Podila verticillata]|nr:hypothetical protein BGZ59_010413 [Podila verticillata]